MSVLDASGSSYLYQTGMLGGKPVAPDRSLDLRALTLSGFATSYTGNANKPDTTEAAEQVAKWNAEGPKIFTVSGDGSKWESLPRWWK